MNNCNLNPTYKELALLLFPVGHTIYTNDSNFNPNTYYGGTWEQVKDKFILACGDTYKINTSGGSADAIVVSHRHNVVDSTNEAQVGGPYTTSSGNNYLRVSSEGSTETGTLKTNSVGEDGKDANLPPYVTRYVWTRTA